jgi:hypothetical protein
LIKIWGIVEGRGSIGRTWLDGSLVFLNYLNGFYKLSI